VTRRILVLCATAATALARESFIVTPEWLSKRMGVKPAPVVIEASWAKLADAKDYHAGHIPGAVHLNTDEFENGYPQWRLRPDHDLHAVIGRHGIGPDTTVVVYGKQTIAAARVWWVMHYAGVRDVRLLDGGFEAWRRAGHPVETQTRPPRPVAFRGKTRGHLLATTGDVVARRESAALVDVRSREEFEGRVSGYTYLDRKGRIPGAIHADNAGQTGAAYMRSDGSLRGVEEIRRLWQDRGVPLGGKEIIFYCGGGWRSSLALLYALELGIENARNYSDGWSGWSTVYGKDPEARGGTPGWRQDGTGRPLEP